MPVAVRRSPSSSDLWSAIVDAPQSLLYEATDWQAAALLCVLHGRIMDGKATAADQGTYAKLSAGLLVTEVDRRRAGVEVHREGQQAGAEPAPVAVMADYADRLSS